MNFLKTGLLAVVMIWGTSAQAAQITEITVVTVTDRIVKVDFMTDGDPAAEDPLRAKVTDEAMNWIKKDAGPWASSKRADRGFEYYLTNMVAGPVEGEPGVYETARLQAGTFRTAVLVDATATSATYTVEFSGILTEKNIALVKEMLAATTKVGRALTNKEVVTVTHKEGAFKTIATFTVIISGGRMNYAK